MDRQEELKSTAKAKVRSVIKCDFCSKECVIKNVRQKIRLCPKCERNRPVIEGAHKKYGSFTKGRLTDAEKQKIVDTRTIGYGSRNWKTTKPKGATE